MYDRQKDMWWRVASLPQPLDECGSVLWNGSVYVGGGRSKQTYRYVMRSDKWLNLPDLNMIHRNGVVGVCLLYF